MKKNVLRKMALTTGVGVSAFRLKLNRGCIPKQEPTPKVSLSALRTEAYEDYLSRQIREALEEARSYEGMPTFRRPYVHVAKTLMAIRRSLTPEERAQIRTPRQVYALLVEHLSREDERFLIEVKNLEAYPKKYSKIISEKLASPRKEPAWIEEGRTPTGLETLPDRVKPTLTSEDPWRLKQSVSAINPKEDHYPYRLK